MATQTEIREQITNRIVEALKTGIAPWRRPWSNLSNTGSPANVVSGKAYRGINVLLLGLSGYRSRWWATFAQVQSLSGRVKKGERATRIVYWRQIEKVKENRDGHELVETFPLLKTYCVFNVEQCEGDGIERFLARPGTVTPFVDFAPAEEVIAAPNARIEYGGNKAVYFPGEDYIQLPPKEIFDSQHEFYATAFHELIHFTGHESRLDRLKKNARFGSEGYAVEELVAEIGGCFLCNEVGVKQSDDLSNQAAYLASWLNVLQADPTAIFSAASQASAATDFILSFSRKDEHGTGEGNEAAAAVAGVGE
ncbi:MAG: ArdC family protein [Acetobacteraceae bacterium]